jgi:hypothetical protein
MPHLVNYAVKRFFLSVAGELSIDVVFTIALHTK